MAFVAERFLMGKAAVFEISKNCFCGNAWEEIRPQGGFSENGEELRLLHIALMQSKVRPAKLGKAAFSGRLFLGGFFWPWGVDKGI